MGTVINFQVLVVNMIASLKPYAINLTKNMDDAHDLLQETVYRALTNHEKYIEGTNLKAWLFTIMKNIFINNYRRAAKRNTLIDTTDNLYFINMPSINMAHTGSGNLMLEDINHAIDSLSDEYRVPFMMHFEGFKYHEIAEDLDLPLGTVKSRIFFARKELKNQLDAYDPS
ncbi:MAG: RNA polymerase sigma factor [Chitinophagales bacterium]|jgi:RNA polymerase sigma factor (sigma-70 family)|nr:RNA polymerase sigma factor [Chitinophagales bacterium]MBP7532976.1 RNA polymerase sigma factor [Chitinophagales bacterium]